MIKLHMLGCLPPQIKVNLSCDGHRYCDLITSKTKSFHFLVYCPSLFLTDLHYFVSSLCTFPPIANPTGPMWDSYPTFSHQPCKQLPKHTARFLSFCHTQNKHFLHILYMTRSFYFPLATTASAFFLG